MNTLIDPSTGSYIVEDGGLKTAPAHQNAVLLALSLEKGSVPGVPSVGATWGTRALKGVAEAEDIALTALAPLVRDGVITNPQATATVNRPQGRVDLEITYEAAGERHTFSTFKRVL